MLTLISLIIIAVVAAVCFAIALVARDTEVRTGFALVGCLFVLIGSVTFLLNSAKIVGANEVGVKVTFGSVDKNTLKSGFHWVAPWSEVESFPTRPKTFSTVATVRTGENGIITTNLSARWSTSKENAADLFTQVRTGDDKTIEKDLVSPNLSAAAGDFLGDKQNLEVINGKNWRPNAQGIEDTVRDYLSKYGVEVDTVRITKTDPDDATDANIKRASAQVVETNIASQAKLTAQAQADRNLIEAKGLKAAADQLKDLTPGQVQLLCAQAGERIMNKNFERNLPTYTLPCQGGASTAVLAGAK